MITSVNNFLPPIWIEGVTLNPYTSRIDVLVPIFELFSSEEEDFILDLHYAMDRPRSAKGRDIVRICGSILTLMEEGTLKLEEELNRAVPEWDALGMIRAWNYDLRLIRGMACKIEGEATLSWCRCSSDCPFWDPDKDAARHNAFQHGFLLYSEKIAKF